MEASGWMHIRMLVLVPVGWQRWLFYRLVLPPCWVLQICFSCCPDFILLCQWLHPGPDGEGDNQRIERGSLHAAGATGERTLGISSLGSFIRDCTLR